MESPLLIKRLSDAALSLKEVPLFGNTPSFPWKSLSEALQQGLGIKSLKLSHHETSFLETTSLLEGMGETPFQFPLSITPLPGTCFFVLSKAALSNLIQHFLSEGNEKKTLSDPSLSEGFIQFILLNCIQTFNQQTPFAELNAVMANSAPLPSDGAFSIDIAIEVNETTTWGRFILPQETKEALTAHFASLPPPEVDLEAHGDFPLTLRLEIGTTTVKVNEWKQVHKGDVVLLDRCTFDPSTHKGTATIKAGSTPLFDARIKENTVKILDIAQIFKESSMSEESHPTDEHTDPENAQDGPLWEPEEKGQTPPIAAKNIPLTIQVEICRMQMSLEQVAKLQAGNVLECGIGKSPQVDLVVDGQPIAKGELVEIGEAIGVKILQLGRE